ncbi:MAG: translocation/assembly module TamB domain-containing protein [Myxococcales bacterium]|nr:translocation/assembly module TamB domain-containing protein [Myxococcales bacterium]
MIGGALLFVCAAVAAVLVHLDLPATRRLVSAQVNGVLASELAGTVEIEHISALGLRGVDGVRVRVRDPEGGQVLHADGISVRIRTIEALRSALSSEGPIMIDLPSVSVGNADVNLDADPSGQLRLEQAFAPRRPSEPSAPNAPPGRAVRVDAPRVRLRHAWVHGTPSVANAPRVDADLGDRAGRVLVEQQGVRAELDRVRLVTRGLPRRLDPKGTIGGRFVMPGRGGQGVDVQAAFDGEVGGIQATAEARLNDRRLDARIDARDPTGAQTSIVVSELATHEPLTFHAEAHGELPRVDGEASLALGKARIMASAVVEASTTTRVKGVVSARDVDLGAVTGSALRTNLGLDARADVAIDEGGVRGEASIDTLPGTIDRQAVPRAEVRARFAGEAAQLRARIHEQTMPTEVALDVVPRAGAEDARLVTAVVRSRIPDLHRVPRLGARFGGSAEIDASARIRLPEQEIDGAEMKVVLSKLEEAKLRIGRLEANARVSHTIDRPVIDARIEGEQLRAGGLDLSAMDARDRIEIAAPRGLTRVTVRDAQLSAARRADEKLEASARLVRIEGASSLRVEGAEVRGVGEPIRADVSRDARELRGFIDAPGIDLRRLARFAGRDDLEVERGVLGLRGEGSIRRGIANATVHAELGGLAMRWVKGARAVLDASIDDRDVDLAVNADAGDVGKLDLRAERVVIGGRFDDPMSWRRAVGHVHVAGDVDLARAETLVPSESLPLADVRGRLAVQGHVGRRDPEGPPEMRLHARTNGLAIAVRSSQPERIDGIEVEPPARWRSNDVDIGVDVRSDGMSGLSGVALQAIDRRGVVVALDAKAILPYAELAKRPPSVLAALFDAPMSVRVELPRRRLDQLPSIASLKEVQGAVQAELDASGTILEPRVRFTARARGVHSAAMPPGTKADTDVSFDYDGRTADLVAKTRSRGDELLELGARVHARAADLVAVMHGDGALPWTASGHARLLSFPLESLPQLAERGIRGRASGVVSLDELHADARAKGRIDLDGFAIGKVEYAKAFVSMDAGEGALAANLRLEQRDGFLDASARTGLAWGAEVTPALDTKQPIEATLSAAAFRAAALQPFVESVLPAVDGRIDADAKARIVPGHAGAELDGKVMLRGGTVQVAALGEELRAVKATATFSPDGTIRVTDVAARGTQGELGADATVRLDGMRIAEARANVRIPRRRPLALAVQGQSVGEISGALALEASQSVDGKTTNVVVEVPKLNVELPQVTKSGVMSLERKDNIRVGVFRDRDKFVRLPFDAADLEKRKETSGEETRMDVDVRLGKIEIQRGSQLRVHLTGNPRLVATGGETTLTGQIRVDGGWVDVQGKKFDIEKGTVTFTGQVPPNPVVVATAGWTAADNTRVYADFVGPVRSGKVTLRSEPPRPRNEILALVLFGTADGVNPQPAPPGRQADGTMRAAVGLGGAFVAQGLTEALDDLAGIRATARVDTTRANPRPEVEFQLSPRISLSFVHVVGTPPLTEPDKNLANIEYRFHRNWSLGTTFGDRGTARLDAIWQKRY